MKEYNYERGIDEMVSYKPLVGKKVGVVMRGENGYKWKGVVQSVSDDDTLMEISDSRDGAIIIINIKEAAHVKEYIESYE